MFQFLTPESPSTSIEVEGIYLPLREAEKGRDNSSVTNLDLRLQQTVYQSKKDLLAVGAKHEELSLSGNLLLLKDYYNQQGSFLFKRQKEVDQFWMTTVSYGTASDRPFKNARDNTLGANYIQRFNAKWFGVLNYSNNRSFLNNIPLPGVFYIHEMSREKMLILGFPVIFWKTPLGPSWSFRYTTFIPWSHQLQLSYYGLGKVHPYLALVQAPESYFRHDRAEVEDRVFWFERRVGAGIEGKVTQKLHFDFFSGMAFDREIFEASDFSGEKENLVNLENTPFFSLKLRYTL